MSLSDDTIASVSIFFHLDVQLAGLRSIFTGVENFSDLLGQKRHPQIAPGITIGPPSLAISQYKKTRIEYVGDRHLLRQRGPLIELTELNEILPSLFEKQGYSLNELVRFCELDTGHHPMIGKGIVDWIRSNVKVNLEGLSNVCNEELKPFSFWASNSDTPLTDKWLNILLQPDTNSPHNRLLWRIIKRAETHGELSDFLKRVKTIKEELARMFGAQ